MFRAARTVFAAVTVAALAMPVQAQNVSANAGRWWNQMPSGSAWTFYNPLTTMYFRVGGIYSFNGTMTTSGDSGHSFTIQDSGGAIIAIGARLMPVVRVELQASGNFTSQVTHNGGGPSYPYFHARSVQLFSNVFLDIGPFIGNPWGLNPFIGGGVGVGFNSVSYGSNFPLEVIYDHTHVTFAANATAGLQWQPINNLIFEVAYRFLHTGRYQDSPGVPGNYRFTSPDAHQVMFSVVVPFSGLARAFGN